MKQRPMKLTQGHFIGHHPEQHKLYRTNVQKKRFAATKQKTGQQEYIYT